jgi:hypothetical protein
VWRPAATGQALRLSPLVQASWAHSSRIECVPLTAARAEPFVFLAGRPAAERTSDARAGWVAALVFLKFAIQNNGRIISFGNHAQLL